MPNFRLIHFHPQQLLKHKRHEIHLPKLLNVSESEVPDLLINQKILLEGNGKLIPLLDESIYGESFIDLIANKIFINTIDISKNGSIMNNPVMKPYLNLLSFVEVKNSLSKLDELFNQPELYQAFIDSTKKLNPIPIIDGSNEAIKENSPTLKSRKNNSPILESRDNNSATLESREIQVRILGGYGIGQINEETGQSVTAGFWVRQQGLAFLTTVGHSALNGTLGPHGTVEFFFVIPNTGTIEFFGNMVRFDVRTVDRGFILPFDDVFVESPFIYNKEFPRAPLLAIADFTRTPDRSIVGALLCKSGFTTGLTCGLVESVDAKKEVDLPGNNGVAEYEDQILVSPMSAYGDSGAPQ
ncbi:hypothetical protein C2G38_2174486 [Gigaspora rosea]|uniref:Trypsin-like cysteine/serine peptidase domain-containing protein n=1 Tax=Gigaspora rosea TaxID=44941 RepID=A0A397VK67_9GLOM|nr:hypothetical protein C2G38_2174486 [Gigaspora rosea]